MCVGLEAQSPTGVSNSLGHVPPLWQDLFGGFLLFFPATVGRGRLQPLPSALCHLHHTIATIDTAMAPQALSRSQGDFFLRGLTSDPPQRSDGRHLLAFRSLQIDTSVAAQANGSSRITLGGTEIFCGIKAEVRSFGDDSDDEDEEAEFQTQDDQELAAEGRKTGRIKCSVD